MRWLVYQIIATYNFGRRSTNTFVSLSSSSSSSTTSSNIFTQSIPEPTEKEIDTLLSFFQRKSKLLVITGAGVSTESNLSDYRGPMGSYKRGHKPMNHTDFVTKESSRKRYWARSMIGWQSFLEARPNNAHYALAQLELAGRVQGIVTQNVDRLHQKAGSIQVVDLHGRNDRVRCLECGYESARRIIQEQLVLLNKQMYAEMNQIQHRIRDYNSGSESGRSNDDTVQRPDGDAEVELSDLSQVSS